MRVLVIGGSGYVASLLLPLLQQNHTLRIFDRQPPSDRALDHIVGDVCDYASVFESAQGMDALLYMAMGRYLEIGTSYHKNVDAMTSSLDANVKGLYLSLCAAHHAGIHHAVYTSSMSIYHETSLTCNYFPDEEITPDARDLYGFTKRLGEEVCRNACREWSMSINVLRLCFPVSTENWLAETQAGTPTLATTETDLARAIDAALTRPFGGFQAFMISGDYDNRILNMSKAKRMLGWEPLSRPGNERTEEGSIE